MSEEIERKKYHQYFKSDLRPAGKRFYKCVDCPPEDLKDLIYTIHQDLFYGAMPDDWIYETIHDAFYDLEDCSLDSFNIEADPYNYQLYEWLGSGYAKEYCAEVLEEGLDAKDIYYIISAAQERAKDRIYRAVEDFINE